MSEKDWSSHVTVSELDPNTSVDDQNQTVYIWLLHEDWCSQYEQLKFLKDLSSNLKDLSIKGFRQRLKTQTKLCYPGKVPTSPLLFH